MITNTSGADIITPVAITSASVKRDIYYFPWNRYHVYLVGMVTGYILYISKLKVKMNKGCLIVFTDLVFC